MVNKAIVNNKKKKVKRLSGNNSYYPTAFITNPCEQLFGPSLNHSADLDLSATSITAHEAKDKSLNNSSLVANESLCDISNSANNGNQKQLHSSSSSPPPPLNLPSHSTTSSSIQAKINYTARDLNAENSRQEQNDSIMVSNVNCRSSPSSSASFDHQVPEAPLPAASNQHELELENQAYYHADQQNNFEYIPAPRWNKAQNCMLEELFKKSRYPKPNELKSFAQRFNVMDTDIEDWFRKRRGRDRKTRRKNEALKNLIDNYLDK